MRRCIALSFCRRCANRRWVTPRFRWQAGLERLRPRLPAGEVLRCLGDEILSNTLVGTGASRTGHAASDYLSRNGLLESEPIYGDDGADR